MTDATRWVTVPQAAKALNVSEVTIGKWIAAGTLTCETRAVPGSRGSTVRRRMVEIEDESPAGISILGLDAAPLPADHRQYGWAYDPPPRNRYRKVSSYVVESECSPDQE